MNDPHSHNPLAGVASSGLKLLTRRLKVDYLADQRYRIERGDGAGPARWVADVGARHQILILGRQHYFESCRHYNIAKRREVIAALRLEQDELSPYSSAHCLYRLASRGDGGTDLNLWFVDDAIREQLGAGAPRLVLPEGLLLALTLEPGRICWVRNPLGNYYVVRNERGCVFSQLSGGMVRDADSFARMAGLPETGEVLSLDQAELPGRLLEGVASLSPGDWTGLWWSGSGQGLALDARQAKIMGGITLGAALLYGLGSSLYLEQRYRAAAAEMEQQQPVINEVLGRIDQIETLSARSNELARPLAEYVPRWRAISKLAVLKELDVHLDSVRINGARVELRGAVDSATALLTRLSREPGVQNARFSAPTRRGQSEEQFVISFELKAGVE